MIPKVATLKPDSSSIPRESGDDPAVQAFAGQSSTVFPARAGMIPHGRLRPAGGVRIPRESGDDPVSLNSSSSAHPYSPRERG